MRLAVGAADSLADGGRENGAKRRRGENQGTGGALLDRQAEQPPRKASDAGGHEGVRYSVKDAARTFVVLVERPETFWASGHQALVIPWKTLLVNRLPQ